MKTKNYIIRVISDTNNSGNMTVLSHFSENGDKRAFTEVLSQNDGFKPFFEAVVY